MAWFDLLRAAPAGARWFVAVGVWLAAAPAWSASPGSVVVVVMDDEMALPIPAVVLTLIGHAEPREARTNASGEAEFSDVPPGTYRLVVVKGGFARETLKGVVVEAGQARVLEVELGPAETGNDYSDVRSGEGPAISPWVMTLRGSVGYDRVLRVPAGGSWPTALQTVPGVARDGGGGAQISGGASDETAYVLDGANVSDPVSGNAPVSIPGAGFFVSNVGTGGSLPVDQPATGGVIELYPHVGGNSLDFDGSLASDPLGRWRRTTARLAGPVAQERLWLTLAHETVAVASAVEPGARSYDGHALLARARLRPSRSHDVAATLLASPSTVPGSATTQAQGGFVSAFRWSWWPSPERRVYTSASVQRTTFDSDAVHDVRLAASGRSHLEVDLDDPLGGAHELRLGVQGSHGAWAVTADEQRAPQGTSGKLGAFVQDWWEPLANVDVVYGCRFDLFQIRDALGETVASGAAPGPRVFAAWDPSGDRRTRITVGYGRIVDTGRLAWVAGPGVRAHAPAMDEGLLDLQGEVVWDVVLRGSMVARRTRNLLDLDGSALGPRDYLRWDLGLHRVFAYGWELDVSYSVTRTVAGSAVVGNTARGYATWDLPTDPWMQTATLAFVYTDELPVPSAVDVARVVAPEPFFGVGERGFAGGSLKQYLPLPEGRLELALEVSSPLRAGPGAGLKAMVGPPRASLGVRVQH